MPTLRIGIIGGTGLEDRLDDVGGVEIEAIECETPFGRPSGPVLVGKVGGGGGREGVPIALLGRHGVGHVLNPAAVPARANVFALKTVGCTHVVAFGATGSLREEIQPGHLVVCDQIIDRTEGRPRTFFEHAAVHVEFADPFCPLMRQWLLQAARAVEGITVHAKGCYVCMEGPSFSTRAESHMHRQWGADVVGMTALPEARLIREAEMGYAMVALPTDYDCWRPRADGDADSVLTEILGNLARATDASVSLLSAALRDVEVLAKSPSPAHDALARAIWSDKSKIDAKEIERLGPLWGKYF